LVWLKSIDFGFREHLQHKSRSARLRRARQFVHLLQDLSLPRKTPNVRTCRAVAPSEGGRETLMLIPCKTNRPIGLLFSSAGENASFVQE
jgi:hypothetical protein